MDAVRFALLGLGLGAIFTLFGSAIVITFKGSGVLNFAAGAIGMVGAYTCFDLRGKHGVPLLIALPIGMLLSALIGVLMHVVVMQRLRSPAATTRIVATLGLMTALSAAATQIWAPNGGTEAVSAFLPRGTVSPLGHLNLGIDRLCLAGIAVAITAVLAAGQKRTRIGLATNAVAEGPVIPALMGWSPVQIGAVSWAVGSATAAVGAILVADISGLSISSITLLVVPGLAAALVGGFESLLLTLVGGMLMGIGESEVSHYVSTPGWATAAPLIAIIVIMVARGRTLPAKSDVAIRLPRVTSGRLGLWSVAFAVAAGIWISVASAEWLGPITISLIFGLIVLSLVLVTGYTGQISLAQFALAGIGAYLTVVFNVEAHLPFWLAIVLATLTTMPVGMIVALPAIRTRGSNLAVATLALATVITQLVLDQAAATPSIASANMGTLSLFGVSFSPITAPRNFAYLVLVVFGVAGVLTAHLRRSSTGLRLLAVRANERAAASLGISVSGMKLLAFALGSAFAAAAGGLIEAQFTVGDFSQFTVPSSINVVLNSVLGGIGWVSGAAVGGASSDAGAVSHLISTWINPSNWLDLAIGISVLIVVVQQPDGVAPFNIDLVRRLQTKLPVPRPGRGRPNLALVASDGRGGGDGPVAEAVRSQPIAIEAHDLAVRFGGQMALDGVSMTINPGEIVGLIGSNGAGKSTLIEVISGFQRASRGTVLAGGAPVDKLSPSGRARAGVIRSFQSVELFEDLTVWENVAVATNPGGATRRFADVIFPGRFADHASTGRALRQFHLEEHADRYPSELNYAARRLVAVARAFAAEPRMLLLDEPAAGLDSTERNELGSEIRGMVEQTGIGVLMVEHDVDFVFGLCDRVVALDSGSVIAAGTPAEVRDDPAVVAAYLGAPAEQADRAMQAVEGRP